MTGPETPEKGIPASEKFKKIKEAQNLLTTILYNPTRKGLNGQLKEICREQKLKLFRNYAKNFPEKWLFKFDQQVFNEWRLEYLENADLEDEDFEELAA